MINHIIEYIMTEKIQKSDWDYSCLAKRELKQLLEKKNVLTYTNNTFERVVRMAKTAYPKTT